MSKELRHALAKDIFNSGLVKNDDCEDLAGYLIEKGYVKRSIIPQSSEITVIQNRLKSQDEILRNTVRHQVGFIPVNRGLN